MGKPEKVGALRYTISEIILRPVVVTSRERGMERAARILDIA
jgi:hypothetical protein